VAAPFASPYHPNLRTVPKLGWVDAAAGEGVS